MNPSHAIVQTRRGRGRPRRLSPEALLDAALALFEEAPDAEFTLAQLARRLQLPITSIYTYFPNREALLDAASERAFARFAWSARTGASRDELLLSWMHAVQRHFEHYPIAQHLLARDRHVSSAWHRVLAPVIALLHAEGLRGEALARTFAWFNNATIGLIQSHAYTARHTPRPAPGLREETTDPATRAALDEFWDHATELDHARWLDEGFRVLVAGVGRAIGDFNQHTHGRNEP